MKLRKTSYLIVIIGIVTFISANAQNEAATTVLEKMSAYYKETPSYHFDITYTLYQGITGTKVSETYKGSLAKKNKNTRFTALQSEIIQANDIQVTMDHENKTMVLADISEKGITSTIGDMEMFLQFFMVSGFETITNQIICELIPKKPSSLLPYNKIKLYLDAQTYRLQRQELFFTNKLPFVDKDGKTIPDTGRLEVLMDKSNKEIPNLHLNTILAVQPNGGIELKKEYASYQLVDQRQSR